MERWLRCIWICILVLIAIFRRRYYGVSDGFLTATLSLMFPMNDMYRRNMYLALAMFLLYGIHNLQLQTPFVTLILIRIPPPPIPLVSHTPVNQLEIYMTNKKKKSQWRIRERRIISFTSKSSHHRRQHVSTIFHYQYIINKKTNI